MERLFNLKGAFASSADFLSLELGLLSEHLQAPLIKKHLCYCSSVKNDVYGQSHKGRQDLSCRLQRVKMLRLVELIRFILAGVNVMLAPFSFSHITASSLCYEEIMKSRYAVP